MDLLPPSSTPTVMSKTGGFSETSVPPWWKQIPVKCRYNFPDYTASQIFTLTAFRSPSRNVFSCCSVFLVSRGYASAPNLYRSPVPFLPLRMRFPFSWLCSLMLFLLYFLWDILVHLFFIDCSMSGIHFPWLVVQWRLPQCCYTW